MEPNKNKKIIIVVVSIVLGLLYAGYLLYKPQASVINYLPYITGVIFLFGGGYFFLLSFGIYKPKYKTDEQQLKVADLLERQGKLLKFSAIVMILYGAYALIRHDPNMYRLDSYVEANKWTNKDKTRLLEIYTNDLARKNREQPELVKDYCECVVDNIMKTMGRKEYIDDLALPTDEQNKIFAPVIKDCSAKYQDRVDSVEKQRK